MDAKNIIDIFGGAQKVVSITRLSKGRISQWIKNNEIPRSWMLAFHYMNPEKIPHPDNTEKKDGQ